MKELHPDKVHGTKLEDTANFFAAEINEAYEYLMANFGENYYSDNNHTEYFEEEILLEKSSLLNYSLSNNIDVIKGKIYEKTGRYINLMNRYKVNYSMTFYTSGGYKNLVINRRFLDKWFFLRYTEINGVYYDDDQVQQMRDDHQRKKQELQLTKKQATMFGVLGVLGVLCKGLFSFLSNFGSDMDTPPR